MVCRFCRLSVNGLVKLRRHFQTAHPMKKSVQKEDSSSSVRCQTYHVCGQCDYKTNQVLCTLIFGCVFSDSKPLLKLHNECELFSYAVVLVEIFIQLSILDAMKQVSVWLNIYIDIKNIYLHLLLRLLRKQFLVHQKPFWTFMTSKHLHVEQSKNR